MRGSATEPTGVLQGVPVSAGPGQSRRGFELCAMYIWTIWLELIQLVAAVNATMKFVRSFLSEEQVLHRIGSVSLWEVKFWILAGFSLKNLSFEGSPSMWIHPHVSASAGSSWTSSPRCRIRFNQSHWLGQQVRERKRQDESGYSVYKRQTQTVWIVRNHMVLWKHSICCCFPQRSATAQLSVSEMLKTIKEFGLFIVSVQNSKINSRLTQTWEVTPS